MRRSLEKIQFSKEPFVEDSEPRRLESIKFSLLSESEIRKAGEVDIWRAVYYDNQRKPLPNGLLDPKLGPANRTGICATCHGKFEDCPGHYGCLALALPVFNIGYFGAIVEILKCICKSCSRVLLEEKEHKELLKKMRNPKFDSLKKNEMKKRIVHKCSGKAIKCWRCGYQNGKVKKDKSLLTIVHDRPRIADGNQKKSKEMKSAVDLPSLLNPVDVLSLFKKMQDQDCEILYLNDRPEKLLLENIPVPPMALRPSVFVDGGMQSNENDITERLKQIIRENACLRYELQETSSKGCTLQWETLQNAVALYINSEAHVGPSFQQQLGKPLSGFVQRLKGKQGRFRGNLSGKRVQYTGRTVISPDPNLKITQVGIPIHMALILTYPERVTRHNIEKLRQCVRNGPKKYPGAKFITESNGTMRDLSFTGRKRVADELKFGYIVHRHLEDGDVVLFNRQPSLHRMSIMCHRARIMQWRTLRFNESVCNPYNADFDGDEMNLHVPQTEEARTEALMLMGVQNNLCTPKNGVVLVASTQDFLTSSFLISRRDTFYDRATFSLMCSYMEDAMDHIDLPTPAIIKSSLRLQPLCPLWAKGIVCHHPTLLQIAMSGIHRPIELWTGKQLFNVLLRPNTRMRVYVNLMVAEKIYCKPDNRKSCKDEAKSKLEDRKASRDETMCPNDGFVYFRNSELICGQLGKATLGNGNKTGLYSVLLRDYNAHAAAACMNRLAKLSARWIGNHGFSIGIDDVQPGKRLNEDKSKKIMEGYSNCDNLIQSFNAGRLELMAGCDAAQTLEAKITAELNSIRESTSGVCMSELHWRNSPLIMSQCGSKGSPINISQMVVCVGQQAVGGRRAPDGFIDRSLPHFPIKSKSPDAKGFVADSFYTGLSATEFFFHTMGGREGLVDTAVKTADTGYMSRRLMKALEDLAVYYDMTVRNPSGTIIQFLYGDDGLDPSQMEGAGGFPLNLKRLLVKAQATCPDGGGVSLSVAEANEKTERILSQHRADSDGGWSHASEKLSEFIETAVSKDKWRISEKQLEVFLGACISRFCSKRMEAGTAIGAIGAQSIGEPGTQMTLKTFHFAGVASMNVTLGVPRIKEIINASKKISTPIITATLEDEENKEMAQTIKGHIEKTLLGQVAKRIELEMTKHKAYVVVELDEIKIRSSKLNINAHTVQKKIPLFLKKKRKDIKELCVIVDNGMVLKVIPETANDDYHFALNWLKNKLPMVIVEGVSSVERAIVAEKPKGDKGKYQMIVEGTGLLEVMGMEGLNGCLTESNHVMEVHKFLGIEAARTSIINEISKVMESHSMDIDIRHMKLLADVMTFKGEVLAVTRVGIAKMKDSVLMLASFEKTADHLFNASLNGRNEKIEGVSECIIMGVPMQVGTGMLKVMQRTQVGPALSYLPDAIVS